MCVLVTQLCLILGYPVDCSPPPGSSVHEIFQSRILECVATPFSRGSSRPRDRNLGILHGRQILFNLSHQGSPVYIHIAIQNSVGNGTPLQYSSLENSIGRGACGGLQSIGPQRIRHNWAHQKIWKNLDFKHICPLRLQKRDYVLLSTSSTSSTSMYLSSWRYNDPNSVHNDNFQRIIFRSLA